MTIRRIIKHTGAQNRRQLTMDDLYERIEAVQRKHHSTCGHCCYDHPAECECGWKGREDEDWARHVSRLVGDMLIDLAGTGQLLASIDQIARS